MAVRKILKMGHSRLLRESEPVKAFNTPELDELIADMFDTMHAADGAGLAAPQIGVLKRVVIFGYDENNRYPDAPPVPKTVLINPVMTPLTDEFDEGWEGCLSVPGMRGVVPRWKKIRYEGFDQFGNKISREADGFHAPISTASCTRCACLISICSVFRKHSMKTRTIECRLRSGIWFCLLRTFHPGRDNAIVRAGGCPA